MWPLRRRSYVSARLFLLVMSTVVVLPLSSCIGMRMLQEIDEILLTLQSVALRWQTCCVESTAAAAVTAWAQGERVRRWSLLWRNVKVEARIYSERGGKWHRRRSCCRVRISSQASCSCIAKLRERQISSCAASGMKLDVCSLIY